MQESHQSNQLADTGVRLYSIRSITIASVLASCFAGGFLLARNFHRLGRPKDARKAVQFGLLSCVTLVILILVIDIPSSLESLSRFVFEGAQAGAMYLYATKTFASTLREHDLAGGKCYSAWRAAGVSIPLLALPLALIFFGTTLFPKAPGLLPSDEFLWGVSNHRGSGIQERGAITWTQLQKEIADYPWLAELAESNGAKKFTPGISVTNLRLDRTLTVEIAGTQDDHAYFCSWGSGSLPEDYLVAGTHSLEGVVPLYHTFFNRNTTELDSLFRKVGVARRELLSPEVDSSSSVNEAAP